MKKKNLKKSRRRFHVLSVDITDKDVNPSTGNAEINLRFDFINGTSDVINAATGETIAPKNLALGYFGERKPRTTTEIPIQDNSLCFIHQLNQYKHLIAIDTNCFRYKFDIIEEEVTLGLGMAFVLLENNRIEPVKHIFATSINSEKPENENWVRLIELMNVNCQCADPRKVGIVVDSDLGNIEDYNNRKVPIFKEYFLPEGYELIFASDKVSDNILNAMIRACHKLSTDSIPLYIQHLNEAQKKS